MGLEECERPLIHHALIEPAYTTVLVSCCQKLFGHRHFIVQLNIFALLNCQLADPVGLTVPYPR